ncbi:MAG: polysaccharide deacetylase family protein [Candidatus Hydrothermarchaeales archaeon]
MREIPMRGLLILCLITGLVSVGCITRSAKVEVSNWPNGYRSAVCTTFDTERASQEDLIAITSILKSKDINATFFIVSSYYQGAPEILKILKDFEVASMSWNQTEWMLSDLNFHYQDIRIKDSDNWLKAHNFKPRGFRAPYLRYNGDTLKIIEELGYVYDSSKIGTMPQDNGVMEVPLAINFDPFWSEKTMKYSTVPTYMAFKKTHNNGELFSFYTHPEKAMKHLPQFIQFLDYIQERNVWTASCNEVAEWWRDRQSLEMSKNEEGVVVKNTGKRAIRGVTLKISPKREVVGAVSVVEEKDAVHAVLPDLNPGTEAVLRLM